MENDSNYRENRKLINYRLDELNEAVGGVEDKLGKMYVDLLKEVGDLKGYVGRKSSIAGALSGFGTSVVVAAASLVAMFRKGS